MFKDITFCAHSPYKECITCRRNKSLYVIPEDELISQIMPPEKPLDEKCEIYLYKQEGK